MPEALKKIVGTTVAFGDVVQLSKERSKNPEANRFERYVGLEHLEPSDLKVRSWGDIADGTTFTSVFRPGQVLFGKRRAYQRKVAVADFSGVCSGDIYVLEPKGDQLLPELLPFICQSEPFYDYVISMSQGGLSPRVNWKALAKYEFALPSLQEQRRIAGVLQASGGTANRLRVAAQELRRTKSAMEIEVIAKPLGLSRGSLHLMSAKPTGDWRLLTGQELLDQGYLLVLQDGNHGSQYPRSSELGTEGIPYIAASDISDDGDIDLRQCKRIRPDRAAKLRIAPASAGDVILTHNATVGRVTRLPDWPTDIVASTSTTYYRCDPALLDPEYLQWFFESAVFRFQLGTIMRQSTRNQVPITTQKRLLFAVPPLEQQQELAGLRSQFLSARRAIRSRLDSATGLSSAIVEAHL